VNIQASRDVVIQFRGGLLDQPYLTLISRAGEAGGAGGASGEIARYARGEDYHLVLQRRLDALLEWMRTESAEPFDAHAYVDGGPVQERVYAQYAGLGWVGKNTCLINPELGSFLFLAEIICTLPLDPDPEGLEQCGSCTRCLDACPTGALPEAGVLDANRCISYLTIELRGAIPEAQRAALGTHIFGCDICQSVCPYNHPATVSSDRAWAPRPAIEQPALIDLWRMPDDELRALIRDSALTRAKLAGLRRNLAVAIGNSGDPDAVAALAVPYADRPSVDDPIVQEHVEWALARHAR
jgi:epoxyqueuosine reductase